MKETRIQKALSYLGTITGSRVLCGPYLVQIDIEDACNLRCIACWSNSPLLKEKRTKQTKTFNVSVFAALVNDMERLGVSRVELVGLGEPFLHPRIYEVLESIGQSSFYSTVVTNGTLIEIDDVPRLCASGLNELQVSLWAGSEDAYIRTHSGGQANASNNFRDIQSILSKIKEEREKKKTKLKINLVNVIMKTNADDLVNMARLAVDMMVDKVIFREVSTFNETRELALDDRDKGVIADLSSHAAALMSEAGCANNLEALVRSMVWKSSPNAGGAQFDQSCPDSFKRRCIVGWNECRITVDGAVTPCCHCGHSVGNIKEMPLSKIWYSTEYNSLRKQMLTSLASNPFCDACFASCQEPNKLRDSSVFRLLEKNWYERLLDKQRPSA